MDFCSLRTGAKSRQIGDYRAWSAKHLMATKQFLYGVTPLIFPNFTFSQKSCLWRNVTRMKYVWSHNFIIWYPPPILACCCCCHSLILPFSQISWINKLWHILTPALLPERASVKQQLLLDFHEFENKWPGGSQLCIYNAWFHRSQTVDFIIKYL